MRTALLTAIFLCTGVSYIKAQTASIDIAKIEAIADAKPIAKNTPAKAKPTKAVELDPATYEDEAQNKQKAKYFNRHISLINNDGFGLKLVANPTPAAPKLAQFTIAKGKVPEKKTITAKDAAYFRKQISMFKANAFGFNLAPYVATKKKSGKKTSKETVGIASIDTVAAVANATSTTTDVPTNIVFDNTTTNAVAGSAPEVKFTAKDAAYFKKRISLLSGDDLKLILVPYKATSKKEKETVGAAPKFKAKDAAYFHKHISLINGDVFQLALLPNGTGQKTASNDLAVTTTVNMVSYAPENKFATGIFTYVPPKEDPISPIPPITDKELQDLLYTKVIATMTETGNYFATIKADSNSAKIPQKMPANITMLKQQIGLVYNDTLRAALYQKVADRWLGYDSISIRTTKRYYQDEAIDLTMKALHTYSKMGDPDGMQLSYTNLAKVYKDQRIFPQAKWFILQANTIAREEKNYKNIINTLIDLSAIKRAVNDHEMAVDDLNEALKIAAQHHLLKQEAAVQSNLAVVYGELNELTKSSNAAKRRDAIEASIRKAAEAKKVAAEKKANDKKTKATADKTKTVPDASENASTPAEPILRSAS